MLEIASAIVVIAAGITLILVLVGFLIGLVVAWLRHRNLSPEERARREQALWGMGEKDPDPKGIRRFRYAYAFMMFAYIFVLATIVFNSWQGAQQKYEQQSEPPVVSQQEQGTMSNQKPIIDGWQTYSNAERGIQLQYPSTYSVTPSTEEERCFLATRSDSACVLSLTLHVGNSNYDPPAYFFLVKGVDVINLAGQTMSVKFDAKQGTWIRISDGALKDEVLQVSGYTSSGQEIIETSTGGSHASFRDYIIPNYEENIVAVFKVPSSRRIRCDLIEEITEKSACETFYNSVVGRYGGREELAGGWLPREHLEVLYADAEDMIRTTQFTASVDTSNWQTYRNDEYGFEVKYPESDVTVQVINRANGYFDRETFRVLYVDTTLNQETTLPTSLPIGAFHIYVDGDPVWLANCLISEVTSKQTPDEVVQINEVQFARFDESDSASGGSRSSRKSYRTMENNKCYRFESSVSWRDISFFKGATTGEPATQEEIAEQEALVQTQVHFNNQILSTFRFVEEE